MSILGSGPDLVVITIDGLNLISANCHPCESLMA